MFEAAAAIAAALGVNPVYNLGTPPIVACLWCPLLVPAPPVARLPRVTFFLWKVDPSAVDIFLRSASRLSGDIVLLNTTGFLTPLSLRPMVLVGEVMSSGSCVGC